MPNQEAHIPYMPEEIQTLAVPTTFDGLKLDTPYLAHLPTNGITNEGNSAIRDYVYYHVAPVFTWPDWWEWSWVVGKDLSGNKCVGTFPKRFARYAAKKYGIKVLQSRC